MTYRSLLVHLDDGERCTARLDLAIGLARRFEAHLAGLAPTGRLPWSGTNGAGLLGVEVVALALAQLRQRAEDRAQRFRERCRIGALKSFEVVVDEADDAASTVHHGHCSDLIVLGQADPAASDPAYARSTVEQVVLHSARPTLIVPWTGPVDTVGQTVLVAWDDSREAARALADAMPLLCQAREVHLVHCETPPRPAATQPPQRLGAVQQWLAWHGVDAQVRQVATDRDVGNALLSHAADLGADLIVMGAYGHARWTERVLGGATRTLLTTMTLPVLMSH
jgi:nucleotide-binding universal stress UspA family protein